MLAIIMDLSGFVAPKSILLFLIDLFNYLLFRLEFMFDLLKLAYTVTVQPWSDYRFI